jgi:hypothetical protein
VRNFNNRIIPDETSKIQSKPILQSGSQLKTQRYSRESSIGKPAETIESTPNHINQSAKATNKSTN